MDRIGQQIVEARTAGCLLQSGDAAEAPIVEQHDGELDAQHHRSRHFRIEHEIGAVTDHHHDLALGLRQFHADAASDLIAHAGEAIFEVVGLTQFDPQRLLQHTIDWLFQARR